MANLPVKFFHSGMAGAPVLSGSAGALLNVLSTCLVDGFNLQTLTSLTVSSNLATGQKSGHGYVANQVVEIAGATPSALNGQWCVSSVTANSFSFVTTGISDQTATGTISAKVAAAGWEKPYSGTNKAAFQSASVTSNKAVLRVDDTGTTSARVVGYESMTDVDTGVGPFPTAAQIAGGAHWFKSDSADASARLWQLIASEKAFYFYRTHYTGLYISGDGFIEYASEKSGDRFNFMLTGCITTTLLSNQGSWSLNSAAEYLSAHMRTWGPRSYTQIGSAIELGPIYANTASFIGRSGAGGMTYPSPLTNGVVLSKCSLPNGGALRCKEFPGILHSPQTLTALSPLDVIENIPGLEGRKVIVLACENSNYGGRVLFDITGPWVH